MLNPIDIMTEARWRTIYGDGFTHTGANLFHTDSYPGNHVLISAMLYLEGTPRYYGRSTAEIAIGPACHHDWMLRDMQGDVQHCVLCGEVRS